MTKLSLTTLSAFTALLVQAQQPRLNAKGHLVLKDTVNVSSISGINTSLAMFNNEGECGTGAVVNWAGKLWAITYGPHMPFGSSDKLYEISKDFIQTIRSESIGGTPANRLIHKESNQLFIGHYVIDSTGFVRVIPIAAMPGRLTGIARSVTEPANKVVIATMEEGFYEVDVHTLAIKTLFKDGNQLKKEGAKSYESDLLVGVHGKGFYSSQGVYVFSNNGEQGEKARTNPRTEAGALCEYDGTSWKLIRRNQFTEVTGPGGIKGNDRKDDPIWATGWDYKSIILALRDKGKWLFYRLPKASNSYDGAHGWNTEWPRIRDIGTEYKSDYLMTMHGMFWRFPKTFSSANSSGIRPRSSYLKVIGDFTRWNNQIVFGCDDAAKSEFLNKRKAKGGIAGPGQSQSNLWVTSLQQIDHLGNTNADGAVWLKEAVASKAISEPFLCANWKYKTLWLKNNSAATTQVSIQIDKLGTNQWLNIQSTKLLPNASQLINLSSIQGEWIRLQSSDSALLSASFVYANDDKRTTASNFIFNGLALLSSKNTIGGLLYSLGNNQKKLGILANVKKGDTTTETGYYEMDEKMQIVLSKNDSNTNFIRKNVAIPSQVLQVTEGAYVLTDANNQSWCLPLGDKMYTSLMEQHSVRICREVSTERDLFNCGGTFYELPAENAGGYAKIKPISSHKFVINDYNSYRGMLMITGIDTTLVKDNAHLVISNDKKCAVWAGVIDDLWKLGKSVGSGGPWVNATVAAGEVSKPYLFSSYDQKEVAITQKSEQSIQLTIEIDPLGENDWVTYKTVEIAPNQTWKLQFPKEVQGRWIRFTSNKKSIITTWLNYY